MKNVGPLLGAFLLGVLCTVGVYEVVRFVTNTRDAIQAASAMASDESTEAAVSTEPDAESRNSAKSPKNRVDVDAAMRDRLAREARERGANTGRKRTAEQRKERRRRRLERKKRRKERWQALSQEERQAIREKSLKRGNRVLQPMAGGRGNFRPGRFEGMRGGDVDDAADAFPEEPRDDDGRDDAERDTGAP